MRKVPNLIIAQGIPLLKYPGPTPVLVNRVLKEKILWGVRKWEQHKEMQVGIQIGEWEDEWDDILAREGGIMDDDGSEAEPPKEIRRDKSQVNIRFYDPESTSSSSSTFSSSLSSDRHTQPRQVSWTTAVRAVDRQIELSVWERGKKYAMLGNRYFEEVIVPERELKEKERKEAKHARRMARKAAAAEVVGQDGEVSSIASGFV